MHIFTRVIFVSKFVISNAGFRIKDTEAAWVFCIFSGVHFLWVLWVTEITAETEIFTSFLFRNK